MPDVIRPDRTDPPLHQREGWVVVRFTDDDPEVRGTWAVWQIDELPPGRGGIGPVEVVEHYLGLCEGVGVYPEAVELLDLANGRKLLVQVDTDGETNFGVSCCDKAAVQATVAKITAMLWEDVREIEVNP